MSSRGAAWRSRNRSQGTVNKPHGFLLAHTEGVEFKPAAISEWREQKALETLKIERVEFENLNGKAQGYARRGRKIAVGLHAALPRRTLFRELARVVFGHCDEQDLSARLA
jgi:hypothetical protein